MDAEFAAKVQEQRDEAAVRQKASLKKGDKKPDPVSQKIDEREPNDRRTDAAIAKQPKQVRTCPRTTPCFA
jgi:hypothetical protein